jgi:hypothetical protein
MISLTCTRLLRMVMDPIDAVDLRCQININGPYCKKKRVRKIGLRAIMKVNYAVV